MRETITSRQEVYAVDIALDQLDADRSNTDVRKLLELATDAERRHFVAWSLEARLAAWRILRSRGCGNSAEVLRKQLEADAGRGGFQRVLNRLHGNARGPS